MVMALVGALDNKTNQGNMFFACFLTKRLSLFEHRRRAIYDEGGSGNGNTTI